MRRVLLAMCVVPALCAWAACTAFSGEDDADKTVENSDGGERDASLATTLDGASSGLDAGDASVADASIAATSFCAAQSGSPLFCDDFEPTSDAAVFAKANKDCTSGSIAIAAAQGRPGHVVRADQVIANNSPVCAYVYSFDKGRASKPLALSFDFQAAPDPKLDYAAVGGFVINYAIIVGVALKANGQLGIGPIGGDSPLLANDGGWHHAVVTMTPVPHPDAASTFSQTTVVDGVTIATTPPPSTAPGTINTLEVDIGVFFSAYNTTEVVVQIDNVLLESK